jgi:hypothetical protein
VYQTVQTIHQSNRLQSRQKGKSSRADVEFRRWLRYGIPYCKDVLKRDKDDEYGPNFRTKYERASKTLAAQRIRALINARDV